MKDGFSVTLWTENKKRQEVFTNLAALACDDCGGPRDRTHWVNFGTKIFYFCEECYENALFILKRKIRKAGL